MKNKIPKNKFNKTYVRPAHWKLQNREIKENLNKRLVWKTQYLQDVDWPKNEL